MKHLKDLGSASIKVLVLALAMTLYLSGSGVLAGGPADDIKSLIDEVLSILHNPALQGQSHKEQRVAQVEKAAASRFDYREMARLSLGETWGILNQVQQNEFVHMFSELLKASYACRLDEFAKAQVTYQPATVKGDCTEVPVVILRPNDKIPVSFRMRQDPQGWKIYDLVIEGVSLADNYRSQFARVIQGGSFKDLMQTLQAKMQEECKD